MSIIKVFTKDLLKGRFYTFTKNPGFDCIRLNQIHSDIIVFHEYANSTMEGDGIWSDVNVPQKPLAILTADCLPIVIIGDKGSAFLHAGWKGIKSKIHLKEEIVNIKPTYAFIGPHIKSCCFEVSADFKDNFPTSPHFKQETGTRFTFDLLGQVESDLRSKFSGIEIESAEACTCCNNKFHSYRRNETSSRNWNVFRL